MGIKEKTLNFPVMFVDKAGKVRTIMAKDTVKKARDGLTEGAAFTVGMTGMKIISRLAIKAVTKL